MREQGEERRERESRVVAFCAKNWWWCGVHKRVVAVLCAIKRFVVL